MRVDLFASAVVELIAKTLLSKSNSSELVARPSSDQLSCLVVTMMACDLPIPTEVNTGYTSKLDEAGEQVDIMSDGRLWI